MLLIAKITLIYMEDIEDEYYPRLNVSESSKDSEEKDIIPSSSPHSSTSLSKHYYHAGEASIVRDYYYTGRI